MDKLVKISITAKDRQLLKEFAARKEFTMQQMFGLLLGVGMWHWDQETAKAIVDQMQKEVEPENEDSPIR